MTTGTHRSGGLQLDPRTAAFVRNVDRVISDHALLEPHQTVLVAVSGGVDSMVLLDYLVSRRDLALNLVIAHLNHALRGEESEGDELLVRETARHHGLPVECGRADIRAVARENRISLEEAGREARYRVFF